MYCWKCGQENAEGSSTCVYCNAKLNRSMPADPVGKAMRMLYDRYGKDTILTKSAYLVNGLGDLAEDTKLFRNQLKTAMDAGVGRLYLDRLASFDKPDAAFEARVKALLSDEAGLNDKAAENMVARFNDMIGWKTGTAAPKPDNNRYAQQSYTRPVEQTPVNREVDRRAVQPEIDRNAKPKPAPKQETAVKPGTTRELHLFESVLILGARIFWFGGMGSGILLALQENIMHSTQDGIIETIGRFALILAGICHVAALVMKPEPVPAGMKNPTLSGTKAHLAIVLFCCICGLIAATSILSSRLGESGTMQAVTIGIAITGVVAFLLLRKVGNSTRQ